MIRIIILLKTTIQNIQWHIFNKETIKQMFLHLINMILNIQQKQILISTSESIKLEHKIRLQCIIDHFLMDIILNGQVQTIIKYKKLNHQLINIR